MGWGKEEESIKGCLFLGTGDAKSVRNMKSLQAQRADATREVDRHQNMLPIPALFHLQMNFAWAIQKAHDGSKPNNPGATRTSKSTLLWHRSITGIKGAHGEKPEYFTLRDLLIKSFRSRIIAAVTFVPIFHLCTRCKRSPQQSYIISCYPFSQCSLAIP